MPATASQVRRAAKRLFRWCVINDSVEETRVREVTQQVLKAKRRGYLAVLSEFKRLLALDSAKHTARIDSAVPLHVQMRSRVADCLERTYGKGLDTQFAENPDLIGGIRIRVSSDVYDGSVRSRLAALAASFGIRSA